MKYDCSCLDTYLNAVNYLSLAQLYLNDNIFLTRKLETGDLKQTSVGHWGTVPGINFIYTHINFFLKQKKQHALLLCGPGHGAAAILANSFVDSSLSYYYPDISYSPDGLFLLVKKFGQTQISQTEANPYIPAIFHQGGELGYSLSVAFGLSLQLISHYIFCIVGDGEAETGAMAASFRLPMLLRQRNHGKLVTILHLNGNKMKSASLLSLMTDKELCDYFSSQGFTVFIISANHVEMINTVAKIDKMFISNAKLNSNFYPIIILKSPKGMTGPQQMNGLPFVGSFYSHKPPNCNYYFNDNISVLEKWFRHYQPSKIFKNNWFSDDVLKILPEKQFRIGFQRDFLLPSVCNNIFKSSEVIENNVSAITKTSNQLDNILASIILHKNNFFIFSPDEAESNGLIETCLVSKKICGSKKLHYDVKPGQIIEILSENVCQGLLQGLLIGGGMGIFVSYEAFLPIISSMIIQYMKYLLQMNYSVFKFDIAPMIIVSTSLGWRNTFSHQQPSFYTDFIQKGFNFVHIFFPADSNVLNVVFEKILEKKNTVNIISISKTNIRTVFSLSAAKKLKTCGYLMKEYWRHQKIDEEADIILCSVGDINTTECQFAIDIVTKYKSYKIKLVSLIDLFRFDKKNESCCSNDEFVSIFTTSKTVIFSYIGYPCDIKTLMLDYPNPERFVFLGYSNSYLTTNQYLLMLKSQISRYSIAKRIWDQLDPDNKYNHVLSKKLSIYDMQECQDMTEEDYLNLSPYV